MSGEGGVTSYSHIFIGGHLEKGWEQDNLEHARLLTDLSNAA